MSLLYIGIDGEIIDKVALSIDRIKNFVPPEGYYVAFSGGKDSIVVYDLVKRSGVNHDTHFNLTTVDPPEVVKFIKDIYPEVEISKPKLSMFQLIIKKHMPPTRIIRFCCSELKERGGKGRVVVTGVRHQESVKRKTRRMVEICMRDTSKWFVHPIIDWTEEDVWEYIRSNNLLYPSPYDRGEKRIGCIMCPMQGPKGMIRDAENYPKYYRAYLRCFGRMLTTMDDRELPNKLNWKTAEDVMNWWIYGKNHDYSTMQTDLFDNPVGCYDGDA